ncbi:meiotic nuclear division protein 1 [Gonapodya prolifera JEL478]|uniref:Meiotic nuclear division protein 1 n=1 Tax=Gonapodya prolifera (strain JEL478) TaxID=1344416 RepID=A0A139A6Y1_GONPJ|nr:meiotic nuclear division protein 1 [Gonapodya prolifera JEL478]|eukprot:KXS12464.1 meiotic nuclear division protein 1 [Gonapodya prolifera JEL478]
MASKKQRGLSFEDKKKKMLEIFMETKDFWTLKELEKMGAKKGVISQSTKEVLDHLVADQLVTMEKIGASNYFWSFPSQVLATRKRKIDDFESELGTHEKRLKELEASIEAAQVGREDTEERKEALRMLTEAQSESNSLLVELRLYKDNDPEVLAKKVKLTAIAKSSAIRWTDNIHTVLSFASRKFGVAKEALLAASEIEEKDILDVEQ